MTASVEESGARSYGQILKSTFLIGGSTAVSIAFALLRNKVAAIVLGPSGVGLMALYTSIIDLAQTMAGMGVSASGVRQIAEAAGTGDDRRIALTVTVLRRVSVALGLAGMAFLLVLSVPVSRFTFGDGGHVLAICVLSLAVLLRVVSAGQGALLQGMRRVGDLARMNVISAMLATVATVPLIILFREAGIAPALVATAAITLVVSWWFSRRIAGGMVLQERPGFSAEAMAMLKLGLAFMVSGLLMAGSAYVIRIILLRVEGASAAGLYQAAWTLGGLYTGFILQAMGTDFYPRLTAASNDDRLSNQLVNEQAEIGILLAAPGLVATLTLAPIVMVVFYSHQFQAAGEILRWICLGMMLRIVSWPIGYVIVARNAKTLFVTTEVLAAIMHLSLVWLLVSRFGAVGAGAAFFGLYLCHAALVYLIVRRMTGFRWSSANMRLILVTVPAAACVFAANWLLPVWPAAIVGVAISLTLGVYCLRELLEIIPQESWPRPLRDLMPGRFHGKA